MIAVLQLEVCCCGNWVSNTCCPVTAAQDSGGSWWVVPTRPPAECSSHLPVDPSPPSSKHKQINKQHSSLNCPGQLVLSSPQAWAQFQAHLWTFKTQRSIQLNNGASSPGTTEPPVCYIAFARPHPSEKATGVSNGVCFLLLPKNYYGHWHSVSP